MLAALLRCIWLFATLYGGIADVTDDTALEGECIPKHSTSLLQAKFEAISPKSSSKLYGKSHETSSSTTAEEDAPAEEEHVAADAAEEERLAAEAAEEEGRLATETAQGAEEEAPAEQNKSGTFATFLPNNNVIVCMCAKCGSTSLYEFMYQTLFGMQWNFTDPPWVQEVSERWKGQLSLISAEAASSLMDTNAEVFSLALVRDPIERLQSAWKSKVACDNECYTIDVNDRMFFVPELLALAGNTSQETCLSFPDFVDTLFFIHGQGKEGSLNRHFLPQNLDCFLDIPVQKWGKVATIKDADVAGELGRHLGNSVVSSFPQTHASSTPECAEELLSSETVRSRLDAITKAEYSVLGMAPPA